jgi:hypothetical protein
VLGCAVFLTAAFGINAAVGKDARSAPVAGGLPFSCQGAPYGWIYESLQGPDGSPAGHGSCRYHFADKDGNAHGVQVQLNWWLPGNPSPRVAEFPTGCGRSLFPSPGQRASDSHWVYGEVTIDGYPDHNASAYLWERDTGGAFLRTLIAQADQSGKARLCPSRVRERQRETSPPKIKAITSYSFQGSEIHLRYLISDNGGWARADAALFTNDRNQSLLWAQSGDFQRATGRERYWFSYAPPSPGVGLYKFCVIAFDRSGLNSKLDCALLDILVGPS